MSLEYEPYPPRTHFEVVSARFAQMSGAGFVSQKVFIKLFFKSQFPHKSVIFSFIINNIKNKLTNMCVN